MTQALKKIELSLDNVLGVGSVVVSQINCLVCEKGEIGLIYEKYIMNGYFPEYPDGYVGYSIIFENGGYDGWDPHLLVKTMLIPHISIPYITKYNFKSVVQLTQDYRNGLFVPAFQEARQRLDDQNG